MDLEDLFKIIGILAVVTVMGFIFIQVLPSTSQLQDLTSIHVYSIIRECESNDLDINCLINEFEDLLNNAQIIYPDNPITIAVINIEQNSIEFWSDEDTRSSRTFQDSRISRCSLFGGCNFFISNLDDIRYRIIIL